ncbi:MAG: HEAT repeat domain-containing protein [Planctomycetes bacterium]|nr:HEAT repeat domain-containing protein [Planctomycetota bacterium]
MAMLITCRCGKKLPIHAGLLGKKVRCGQCGATLQIPASLPRGPAADTAAGKGPGSPAPAAGTGAPEAAPQPPPGLEEPSLDVPPGLEEPSLDAPPLEEAPLEGASLELPPPEHAPGGDPAPDAVVDAASASAALSQKLDNLSLQLEGDSKPAAPDSSATAGQGSGGPCPQHPESPATEKCPQCQRSFCKACLQDMPGTGVLCSQCRAIMASALGQKKIKRRKLILLASASAALLLGLGGLGLWFFLFSSKAGTETPPAASGTAADPGTGTTASVGSTSTTTSVQPEDPAPDEWPPSIAIENLEPPPDELPPPVAAEIAAPPPPAQRDEEELARTAQAGAEFRRQILSALEQKLTGLRQQLKNKNLTTRKRAVQDLVKLEHRLCLDPLREALKDENEEVRLWAATQLGRLGSARSVQALAESLQQDSSAKVRAAAAASIGRCGDESAIPALILGLAHADAAVREASDRALRQLSTENIAFDPRRPPEEQADAVGLWRMWFYKSRNKVIRGDEYRMRTAIGQSFATRQLGGEGTLAAAADAHQWLAMAQEPAGFWDPAKHAAPGTKPAGTASNHALGVTSLALLSFLASGNTPEAGQHAAVASRAVEWLLKNQREDGRFEFQGSSMDDHGVSTLALCEIYGMTGNSSVRAPAERAVRCIVENQGEQGGFSATGPGCDTWTSAWQFLALSAAAEAGLEVPEATLRRADYFLRYLYRVDGGTASGVDLEKNELTAASPATTALGVLCRQFFSYPKDDREIQRSLHEHLLKWEPDFKNLSAVHHVTLVLFQVGGKEWTDWNARFKERLLALQEREGSLRGSWPADAAGEGTFSGRVASTAFATLCLQTYYRYAPVYK